MRNNNFKQGKSNNNNKFFVKQSNYTKQESNNNPGSNAKQESNSKQGSNAKQESNSKQGSNTKQESNTNPGSNAKQESNSKQVSNTNMFRTSGTSSVKKTEPKMISFDNNLKTIVDLKPSFIITLFYNKGKENDLAQIKETLKSIQTSGVTVCIDIVCSEENWKTMKYLTKCSHLLLWYIEAYDLSTQILMSKIEGKSHPNTYIIGAQGIEKFFPSSKSKFQFIFASELNFLVETIPKLCSENIKPLCTFSTQEYDNYMKPKEMNKDKDVDSDLLNYYVPMYHVTITNKEKDAKAQLIIKVYVPGKTEKNDVQYELFKSGGLIYFVITGEKTIEEKCLESTRFKGKFKLRLSFLKESLNYPKTLPAKPSQDPLIENGMIQFVYDFI